MELILKIWEHIWPFVLLLAALALMPEFRLKNFVGAIPILGIAVAVALLFRAQTAFVPGTNAYQTFLFGNALVEFLSMLCMGTAMSTWLYATLVALDWQPKT